MTTLPDTDLHGSDAGARATATLRAHGAAWWRAGDAAALASACAAVPDGELADWPEVAFWRALSAFLAERAEALDCLALAQRGFASAGEAEAAALACHAALAVALLDVGAMDRSADWLARARALPEGLDPAASTPPGDAPLADPALRAFWWRLGWLARVAFGEPEGEPALAATRALQAQLKPLGSTLAPDERLMAAQLLLDIHFARQRYEQFDALAAQVGEGATSVAAAPLMRARWWFTLGFAYYQVGDHARAEACWQRGLETAAPAGLQHVRLLCSLALVRSWVDRGRLDEAAQLLDGVQPAWGGGRITQLVELAQMRGRVLLLRGQAAAAAARLDDALHLADDAGLPPAERASCETDRVQALVALGRDDEAAALLDRLIAQAGDRPRDAQVFGVLRGLWAARRLRPVDPAQARRALDEALADAQALRYTMFFRLLPALAAELCALALRWELHAPFVREVIAARALPAPPEADGRWPWPWWLRLLGGFELLQGGQPAAQTPGKTPHKPLELLRLLACERRMALGMAAAADALWPQADAAAGRKNLEMTVQRLRKLLGDDSLVRVADGRVALDAQRIGCDLLLRRRQVERLEALALRAGAEPQAAADGAPTDGSGDAAAARRVACLDAVEQVLALGTGPLLPGAPDAIWLDAERARCAQDTVRAALAAAAVLEGLGVGPAELALLRQALAVEPLAEPLVARLMHCHARAGERSQALHAFEQYRRGAEARGLAPGPALLALWRQISARA